MADENVGGDRRRKGPLFDRVLMRLKDVIIIGTAAFALIKWFLIAPVQMQDRVTRQEQILTKQQETLDKIAVTLEVQVSKLSGIEKRFGDFQRSFYSKKPGGWVYEDDRWKWEQNEQPRK